MSSGQRLALFGYSIVLPIRSANSARITPPQTESGHELNNLLKVNLVSDVTSSPVHTCSIYLVLLDIKARVQTYRMIQYSDLGKLKIRRLGQDHQKKRIARSFTTFAGAKGARARPRVTSVSAFVRQW